MATRHSDRRGKALKLVETGMDIPELKSRLEKTIKSTTDLVIITPAVLEQWKTPPFQRPLRVNARVMEVAEQIKLNKGVVPGMLTLGVINGVMYIVDGQHRIHALKIAMEDGIKEGLAEVRVAYFDSIPEMAKEFVNLNRSLVLLRPDDVLRGMEGSIEALGVLKKKCPAIGYDNVRHNEYNAMFSMSAVLRVWHAAMVETPTTAGMSALPMAQRLTVEEAKHCADFLNLCVEAWGYDREYHRLYASLNLSLCAWLYRRLVLGQHRTAATRYVKLTPEQFRSCLNSLSTSPRYLDYLVNRKLSDRDRSPAFLRICTLFVRRLSDLTGKKVLLPSPAWAAKSGREAV